MEEQIKTRIAELERERDQLVSQANQQIAAYGGAIAELKKLIEPKPEQKPEQPATAS